MAENLDASDDLTADVVVVGFGGAGAVAALRTVELGGTVIIVEKQPKDDHTPSTRLCGGVIFGVVDVEKGAHYMDQCAGGMIPYEVTRAWAEKAFTMREWLDEQGLDLRLQPVGGAENPEFEGAEGVEVYRQARLKDGTEIELVNGGSIHSTKMMAQGGASEAINANGDVVTIMDCAGGPEYFRALREAVEARSDNIRVIYEAPASSLIQDESGRVVGVSCATNDGEIMVHGTGGVLLACGGYGYDEELCINYLKASPTYFYGNPGNNGDGVRMAQAVGADLWHMNQMIGRAMGHVTLDDGRPLTFLPTIAGRLDSGYLITDKHGKRFADEYPQSVMKHSFYYHLLQYDPEAHDYPRIPCYWFFDEKRFKSPITTAGVGLLGTGYYDWSPDNSKEFAKGWIKKADTIEELAEMMGISDPGAAAAEVEAFNEAARAGNGDAFGRPDASLIPLEGPFYCVELWPGGPNTCGGPRRNEKAEIVDPYGNAIPGLYGAGELGEAVGMLYPADGGNLSESVAFGRIAAESMMASVAAATS